MEEKEREEKTNGEKKKTEKSRGRRITKNREDPVEAEILPAGFLPKDDLSRFLAIKPYLSPKGRAVVELLEELDQKGTNRLDPGVLLRLFSLFGAESNLATLGPLLGMLTPGSKPDPATLVSLLGALAQNMGRQEKEEKEEEE